MTSPDLVRHFEELGAPLPAYLVTTVAGGAAAVTSRATGGQAVTSVGLDSGRAVVGIQRPRGRTAAWSVVLHLPAADQLIGAARCSSRVKTRPGRLQYSQTDC